MKMLLAILAALRTFFPTDSEPQPAEVPPATTTTSIRLIERGAILAEDFDTKDLDRGKWRVWQANADRTTVGQEEGRLKLKARGPIGHNGLWGLTTSSSQGFSGRGPFDSSSSAET